MFSPMRRLSLCSRHESVPPRDRLHLHIHCAFASDAQLVRPGDGAISEQLRGKSATRLHGMQIQKNNADQNLVNHILHHD